MIKRLLPLGFGLIAVAVWLITLGLRQCQEEGYLVPCPESYYGLSIFILLTLGLVSLAISISTQRSGRRNE
ncbi:MAG TPA: hypothetical protein VMU35_00060 [Methylomirabilota bacterium]|nr:hypothetical protein [Methylomirabilota bacterium]